VVFLETQAQVVLKAPKVILVLQDRLELQVPLAVLARKASRVQRELQAMLVLWAQSDLQVSKAQSALQETLVRQVLKVYKESKGLKVQKG